MAVATFVDEPLHARDCFRRGQAMQVEPTACSVFSSSQPSEFSPINAWGGEVSLRTMTVLPGG
jgi:hypothetical protein